ncbi:hypothetical protein BHF71_05530 [Vulcanibacillus modesticaldus]|uniref:DUF4367 domain-containing protein n=1 Tax=Vulcanibacillus modesticaldus TaxID=337097 RepID=A0A1D2YX02_9BACI|nr:DUF4367 domain-containing protein [Vulcanibacillus modesticaldus]OEG00249.1 hypothetical protein BHF71_05530 [Vulcanibacillus modesticaldus]
MLRVRWSLVIVISLLLLVSGCGQKDSEDIVDDLEAKLNSLSSYKALGTMKILSGDTSLDYSVEVWYKEPYYYRILLTNVNKNITQIVLRNDDGVFVIDPALNKSYRFKSDWPESNGAVYLYHSLASSIIDDNGRIFTLEGDNYLFEVKANYQNKTLSKQKVWLDKKLRPLKVTVYDPKQTKLVDMVFTEFNFDVRFDDDAFDMERNLTGWDFGTLPTLSNADDSTSFGVIEPAYIPDGVTKNAPKFLDKEDGKSVVIKYSGTYNYSLIESKPKAMMASAPETSKNDIVDLGFGLGVLTEMEVTNTRTLTWTYNGVEFKLIGDLPVDEMINVAQSVFGQTGK